MQPLEFKLTNTQRNVRLIRVLVVLPIIVLLRVAAFGPGALFLLILYVPLGALSVVASLKSVVTLTPQGITRWLFGKRFIGWNEVQRIDQRTVGLLGTKTVVVMLTNGKRKRLAVPVSDWMTSDAYFDQKVAAMQQYHLAVLGHAPQGPAPQQAAPQAYPAQGYQPQGYPARQGPAAQQGYTGRQGYPGGWQGEQTRPMPVSRPQPGQQLSGPRGQDQETQRYRPPQSW